MGGSGSEMSSIATVTFMPGRSIAWSGSQPSGWLIAHRIALLTLGSPSIGGFG